MSSVLFLPDHLSVGMGVVDVRTERFQSVEDIEVLAAPSTRFIDPSRIALNPDCGFAPDSDEPPTIDEAYGKLSRLSAASKRLRDRFAGGS